MHLTAKKLPNPLKNLIIIWIREGSNICFWQKDINMTSGGRGSDITAFFLETYALEIKVYRVYWRNIIFIPLKMCGNRVIQITLF